MGNEKLFCPQIIKNWLDDEVFGLLLSWGGFFSRKKFESKYC
jgi:hypothetical protein